MAKKKKYHIRNWKHYNKALVNRGSLTLWFDEKVIENWYSVTHSGERGRPKLYSDIALECCLSIKAMFQLPLRATERFVNSLFQLVNLPLIAPHYTSIKV